MRKIYPVYFTCSNHYNELTSSINSIVSVCYQLTQRIYIYCDIDDYFSQDQIDGIKKICPDVVIRKTESSMSWGGVKTVENELYGFYEISKEIDDGYIMNVDSDLIFISDAILRHVSNSESDLIGNLMEVIFVSQLDESIKSDVIRFHQGSCYFIKSNFAKQLIVHYGKNRDAIIDWACRTCSVHYAAIPPDVTISKIAYGANAKIEYVDFFVSNDKSVIHLELTKNDHWSDFGKLMGIQSYGEHRIVKYDSSNGPIIYHAPGLNKFSPKWLMFSNNILLDKNINIKWNNKHDTTILTWNNTGEKLLLEKCFEKFNIGYRFIDCGCPYNKNGKMFDEAWRKFLEQKIPKTIEFLKSINSKYVIAADGNDCVIVNDPDKIVEFLINSGKKMIFNGNAIFYPFIEDCSILKEAKQFQDSIYGNEKYKYLNTGVWVGEREFAIEVMTRSIEMCSEYFSSFPWLRNDQGLINFSFSSFYPSIGIDTSGAIFRAS